MSETEKMGPWVEKTCLYCEGTGKSGNLRPRTCPKCHGRGVVEIMYVYVEKQNSVNKH